MKNIPEDAKLVFKGEIFEVFQWDQEMYDGTTMVFEHLRRMDTVIVIPVTSDGKILMQEEEQPNKPLFITFCAGKVDPGETPEEAAERELLEETGYESDQLNKWFVENRVAKLDWNMHVFIARNCKKVADQKLENGEKVKVFEVDFEGFMEQVSDDNYQNLRIKNEVLKAKLDPAKMQDLKELLFN